MMAYEYLNPDDSYDPYRLPSVEIFYHEGDNTVDFNDNPAVSSHYEMQGTGFYYAYGFPGCLPDSEPVGPFTTYGAALDAARGWDNG